MLMRVDVTWGPPADERGVDDDPYMQPVESPPPGLRPELLRVVRGRRGEPTPATCGRDAFFQEVARLLAEAHAHPVPLVRRRRRR